MVRIKFNPFFSWCAFRCRVWLQGNIILGHSSWGVLAVYEARSYIPRASLFSGCMRGPQPRGNIAERSKTPGGEMQCVCDRRSIGVFGLFSQFVRALLFSPLLFGWVTG